MLRNLKTGVLHRNPKPHVKSIHAYFPSVVVMPDGELAATLVLGEAFEATNLHTHFARSSDELSGRTALSPRRRDRGSARIRRRRGRQRAGRVRQADIRLGCGRFLDVDHSVLVFGEFGGLFPCGTVPPVAFGRPIGGPVSRTKIALTRE